VKEEVVVEKPVEETLQVRGRRSRSAGGDDGALLFDSASRRLRDERRGVLPGV